ncbi:MULTISPECIES: hypothetical protein [Flavobacteriaceae]|uniref:DUF3244 domain-containing protein n=1 Tax=Flagellimonas alvinocaridis TaxID=2530200 RepID=A0A4S8RJF5_9FLAO|nr:MULTISPECIES: hypothetical protein [Allomuricauda]MDC6364284.1 hypothetical protein [Muricauda sp. SP22]THV57742.1 hypothetical protein EZV76_14195 [Allomuricauda alvinocaridis]
MKSVVKYTVAMAFLFATAIGVANGPAKSEVERKLINVDLDPVFVKKGGKLMMNLLNLSEGAVTVKVYDSQKRLVYNETIDGQVVVEKSFNFEKAFEDEYTVVVSDKKGTYKETVVVR